MEKSIKLLLYNGTLNGMIDIDDSTWNGEMRISPREDIHNLFPIKKFGVYLLLSTDRVYVGQSQDLEKRINQHLTGKDWWERVVLLTTKDDSFDRADIDYLESVLIEKAKNAESLESDNKNKGNNQKVSKYKKVALNQYLDGVYFLMKLVGISVFENQKKQPDLRKRKPETAIQSNENRKASNTNKTSFYQERGQENQSKCPLPDKALKPGEFAKTALKNLLNSGYIFTDEQIALYSSIDGSQAYTRRNLPLFWILNDGESRKTCDKSIRDRYWKDEFISGCHRFLMFSQWYEGRGATKENFINWYNTL